MPAIAYTAYAMRDGRPYPARLLREARKRAELTQEQVAIRAGTKQSTISRVETGEEEPTLARLCELLWVMGFDLGVLEPRRRPIPADPDSVLHNLSQTLDQRADVALGWNEFGGELSKAGAQMRKQELERLLSAE